MHKYETSYSLYDDRTPIASSHIRPENDDDARVSNDRKFEPQGYRDVLFAFLFVFHLLGIGTLWIMGLIKGDVEQSAEEVEQEWLPSSYATFKRFLLICASTIVAGALLCYFWVLLVKKFTRQLIIGTLVASIIIWIGFGLWMLIREQLIAGIIILCMAALHAVLYYMWRSRIPFATAMLETVAARIEDFPAMTYTAFISLLFQIGWVVIWVWSVQSAQRLTSSSSTGSYLFTVFLIFSFYWTAQVIKNVVHVTVSGVFATWYFLSGTVGIPHNPTLKSLKRATTTSFGSICLGSLLVAALKTLRTLVRSMRNERNGFLVLIVDCILSILDALIQYFNLYAFSQVAIYGKSYCGAARETWSLLRSHGVQAIINDNIISGVLNLGCIIVAVLCGIVSGVMATLLIPEYWIITAVVGLVIGFVLALVVMEVVESGVATIFVCFAMDPLALQRNDPMLYRKFSETYSNYISFV